MSWERHILLVYGHPRTHQVHAEMRQDVQIVLISIAEDVGLKHLVSLLSKGIYFSHLGRYTLIISVFCLQIIQEALHIITNDLSILKAFLPVLQLLSAEEQRMRGIGILL